MIRHTLSIVILSLFACYSVIADDLSTRAYYQQPTWKPRAILPTDDALSGKFWPASPPVHVTYDDPGFDEAKLSQVPAPGVHPRVLMNPTDIETIRAKVALGDKAPLAFRVMWQRVSDSKSAFYALVAKDDVLGNQLARQLAEKMKTLEPKLDELENRPDRDNLWVLERSIIASGEPDPPSEIWDLLDYDYLYQWLTPDERDQARRIIAKITAHRISNFMMVPDHFMTNNHQGFGMEYIRLMLLIEGEKGFDKQIFDLAAQKAHRMLDWYLDDDGMCYESIKGWLNDSALVAVAQRDRNLLKHDHLRAKMRFFQAALRWENGQWKIRDEMRASAFHVIWMMHYYHPKDEGIDLLYKATFTTHDFLTDATAKWPNPVGITNDLLLLWADDGMVDEKGTPLDWNDQSRIDSLHLPLTWQDNQRGYVDTRNSWRKDDLHLGFVNKQDFFYGGHEGSENNRLTLWCNGVNWIQDLNMLAVKATYLQNMLTVDGEGCHWPPAPGTWLGVHESPEGLVAAGDGKDGFSYTKVMQVHPLDFPSAKLGYYAPFAEGNFDFTRDQQVAFNPRTVKWNDGYAHTDYGPWSGETRLVEDYRPWNPMLQDYRTVHLARGANPYVLVLDDANKDNQPHQFDWNISVPEDTVLVDAVTPEIVFQSTNPSGIREDDLVLGKEGTPRDPKSGKLVPNKGDPLCLIRVLWRNTDYGFPVPRLEHFQGYGHVVIPAHSVSPEFRVLIYPFRMGDPLPKTTWNRDRTELTVQIKDQDDVYHLGQTDGGRTVLSMTRNGQDAVSSNAPPARPVLLVRGDRFDINDLRYTREENHAPTYLVDDSTPVAFELPLRPTARIHYTLDGTDPTETSPTYVTSLAIKQSCDLKACVFDPEWMCGPKQSEIFTAHFHAVSAAQGLSNPPPKSNPGLLAQVYEIKTVMWNDHGFFDASKVMLPKLAQAKPILAIATDNFTLPHAVPTHPQEEQCKAFYRFTGWFQAPQRGVYQFAVNSCGPVTLDFGQQNAIASTGVFHQQQKVRYGEVVLDKGWQPIELVVCDPLFWNINSLDAMPFSVTYRINGGQAQTIAAGNLRFSPEPNLPLAAAPEPATHPAIALTTRLEPGFDLQVYDRTGKRRDPDFLDIDGLVPFHQERTTEMEDNPSRNAVFCYTGYLNAPVSGLYTFDLPMRKGESAGLGALQATCQNQLRIDDEIVVQRGVPGRNPTRQVILQQGMHPISIRLGPSVAAGTVLCPDGQTIPLSAQFIFRPVLVSIQPEGAETQASLYEIYAPTKVTLSLPGDQHSTIRYTLDGKLPDSSSPAYSSPLTIDKTTQITAVAFASGQPVTALASRTFQLVTTPQVGLLGQVNFNKWNGQSGPFDSGPGFGLWISPDGTSTEGLHGQALAMFTASSSTTSGKTQNVDVNVSHGSAKAGFKLHHIKMRENALTVALWFKSDTGTGKLFGKDGYNAFGKGYKTFSCSLDNGRILASPDHLAGGKITPNTWQHLVLTADFHEMSLYLNGERIATGPGTPDLTTDALDFFVNHPSVVDSLKVYDRLLKPEEVHQLFINQRE